MLAACLLLQELAAVDRPGQEAGAADKLSVGAWPQVLAQI